MINACLQFLLSQLNDYLSLRIRTPFCCCPVHNGDGKWVSKPSLSVINIEEERFTREQERVRMDKDFAVAQFRQPPIKLNLQLLFAVPCNFSDLDPEATQRSYLENLELLSDVIAYFQAMPRFTADQYPALAAADIQRITLELLTLTPEQMNQIWSCIGTRYVPSAVYRLRLLQLASDLPFVDQPLVTSASTVQEPTQ